MLRTHSNSHTDVRVGSGLARSVHRMCPPAHIYLVTQANAVESCAVPAVTTSQAPEACVQPIGAPQPHLFTANLKYSVTIVAEPFKLIVFLLRTAVAAIVGGLLAL